MGAVDDFRKVLQDFLAPELRAVNARLDAIEKVMDAHHREILARFESEKTAADARHIEISARFDSLQRLFELDKRVERLEGREPRA
jgi:hypothetical protein